MEEDRDRSTKAVIRVFGGVTLNGKPLHAIPERLLAILVAAGPTGGKTTAALADEIWPHDLPPNWEALARTQISRLRRLFPKEQLAIPRSAPRYHLDPNATSVDAWRISVEVDRIRATPALLRQVLGAEPFETVEPSPGIRSYIAYLNDQRSRLLETIVRQGDDALLGNALAAIHEFGQSDPFDDRRVSSAIHALRFCGAPQLAERLLTTTLSELNDSATPPGPRLVAATRDRPVHPASESIMPPSRPPTWRGPRSAPPSPMVGRDAELDLLTRVNTTARWCCLLGESGSGKSALLSAVAEKLFEQDHHVIWLQASQQLTSRLSPLTALIPELLSLQSTLESPARQAPSGAYHLALEELAGAFPQKKVVVAVDDSQWLDSESLRFLEYLARSESATRFGIAVAGVTPEPGTAWSAFVDGCSSLTGQHPVCLEGLDHSELMRLVAAEHPETSLTARSYAATELLSRVNGNPKLALGLLRHANPLTLDMETIPADESRTWERFDPGTRKFGAAASVIGRTFTLRQAMQIARICEEDALVSLEVLLGAGVVIEAERAEEIKFVTSLDQHAAMATVSKARCRQWHLELASSVQCPHARARHLYEAAQPDHQAETTRSLLSSAMAYYDTGRYYEAVRDFRRATPGSLSELGITQRLAFADSLDRIGACSRLVRSSALRQARDIGRVALEFRVIRSAIESYSRAERDDTIVDQLLTVDRALLSRSNRFEHALCLTQELNSLGRTDEASRWRSVALAEQDGPDQRVRVWLADSMTDLRDPYREVPDLAGASKATRLKALLVRSVQACERGETESGLAFCRRLMRETADEPAPLHWRARLLEATQLGILGDTELARARSKETAEFGRAHGVAQADINQVAQQAWLDRLQPSNSRPEMANPIVGTGPLLEVATTVLHRHFACDPDAQHLASELATRALEERSASSTDTLMLITPVLATVGHATQLKQRVADHLAPSVGRARVAGLGFAHLGPVSAAAALVETDPERAKSLRTQARHEIKSWGLDGMVL